ncbi:hypothetical protein D3C86_2057410 [compost metagenome]
MVVKTDKQEAPTRGNGPTFFPVGAPDSRGLQFLRSAAITNLCLKKTKRRGQLSQTDLDNASFLPRLKHVFKSGKKIVLADKDI